jgi:hypothetical protein
MSEDPMTAILRIEHPVGDFERWQRAFDSDPEGRERSGVRRYRVMRACEDPNVVLIDLEFDAPAAAQEFLTRLQRMWSRVDVIRDPQARVVCLVEERLLGQAEPP